MRQKKYSKLIELRKNTMIAQELFHGFELDKFSKSAVQMSKKEFNHRMKQNKIFYKL